MTLFAGGPILSKDIAQSLLQFRQWARNIESGTEALLPLATTEDTSNRLVEIVHKAESVSNELKALYDEIAREALASES